MAERTGALRENKKCSVHDILVSSNPGWIEVWVQLTSVLL